MAWRTGLELAGICVAIANAYGDKFGNGRSGR
jgi:hypothetical protein